MNKLTLLAILFFLNNQIMFSQNGFGSKNLITQPQNTITNLTCGYSADIDSDGDNDVIVCSKANDHIFWYENLNGNGEFGNPITISNNAGGPAWITMADLDADNDPDLICASETDNTIYWYENNGGTFGTKQIVNGSCLQVSFIHIKDINQDGHPDILATSSGDNTLSWFENVDGLGSFGSRNIIDSNILDICKATAADFDNDGDIDIATASTGYSPMLWFENNNGIFTRNNIPHVYQRGSLLINDVDNDNYPDIITIRDNSAYVLEYNANNNSFFRSKSGTPFGNLYEAILYDIDKNGNKDLLVNNQDNDETGVYVLKDSPGAFFTWNPEHQLTNAINNAVYMQMADMDGDGFEDLLTISSDDNKIAWHKNMNDSVTFGNQEVINRNESAPIDVEVCDIDMDNDPDIILACNESGRLNWYDNTDGYGSFEVNTASSTLPNIHSIEPADIDLDGFSDIYVATNSSFGMIYWIKNLGGSGDFSKIKLIDNASSTSLHSADLDGDSDTDLLASQGDYGSINWFDNTGVFNQEWNKSFIGGVNDYSLSTFSADVDGDGDLDVVASDIDNSTQMGDLYWIENINGNGSFGNEQLIASNIFRPSAVFVTDIDGDTDNDILTVSISKAQWHENMDGNGSFSSQKNIANGLNNGHDIIAVDLDLDNDMDVVLSTSTGIYWLINTDGAGNFTAKNAITTSLNGSTKIAAADFSGDGYPDIAYSCENNEAGWFENQISASVKQPLKRFVKVFPSPASDKIFIELSNAKTTQIRLYSAYGKKVLDIHAPNIKSIDVNHLSPGMYFLKIKTTEGTFIRKEIINKS